jgi:hypothetical protein
MENPFVYEGPPTLAGYVCMAGGCRTIIDFVFAPSTGKSEIYQHEFEMPANYEESEADPVELHRKWIAPLLRVFVQHAGKLLTHGKILREIWGRKKMSGSAICGYTSPTCAANSKGTPPNRN